MSENNCMGRRRFLSFIFPLVSVCFVLGSCSAPDITPVPTPAPEPESPGLQQWVADGVIYSEEYAGAEKYGDFEIRWRNDEQYIYIGIRVKTDGWVSVAFQPGTRMKDADMILGLVENNEPVIFDLFSTGDFGPHYSDEELGGTNDILEFDGSEDEEYTVIEFKRALNSGDAYDLDVLPGENKIIWAFGSSDDVTRKHFSRGYGQITIKS